MVCRVYIQIYIYICLYLYTCIYVPLARSKHHPYWLLKRFFRSTFCSECFKIDIQQTLSMIGKTSPNCVMSLLMGILDMG